MISLIFICLAAICNAIMDVSQFHYYKSIFSKYNAYWWNGEISWTSKYINHDVKQGRIKWLWGLINKPVQLTDAFHFFKMWMIIFVCLSIVTFNPQFAFISPSILSYIIMVGIYGFLWNCWFSLFYNRILRKD